MGRFATMRTAPDDTAPPADAVQCDPVDVIADWCADWMRYNRQSRMPAPCPMDARGAAQWWLDHVWREPRPIDNSDDRFALSNWIAEARSGLSGFLRLTAMQRAWVVDLAKQTRYRGDSWAAYQAICEGHEELVENRDAYITDCLSRLKRLVRT